MANDMGDSRLLIKILLENLPQTENGWTGVEIGVFRGATSAHLLRAFPNLFLYMIDPWDEYDPDSAYYKSGDRCSRFNINQQSENQRLAEKATEFSLPRRSILRLPSRIGAERLGGRSFEFVFIDGDHTYEAVSEDIDLWWPKVRTGCLLVGHDYNHPRNATGKFGVNRAVNEFVESEGLELNVVGTCWWVRKTRSEDNVAEADAGNALSE